MNTSDSKKAPIKSLNFEQLSDSKQHIRQIGINLNHWYAAACSSELKANPISVTIWHQAIVLYRDSQGQVHALEDRCPHRQVKLSEGQVRGNELECAYHGWRVNPIGQCSHVPYLSESQKLPPCQIRTYPVREQDGFIWLFPGERNQLESQAIQPLKLPEWDHLNYIASVATLECEAHFSFVIENLMDMYHGHLHQDYQAWADPKLQELEVEGDRVSARYQAQSYYKIDRIWSISQLFFPALRRLHPEPLEVSYVYPHWTSKLGEDFRIYCLFCPVHETRTRAYLVHFTSLEAFPRLHKLSGSFRRFIKSLCFGAAQGLLQGLIRQDIKMIEQEQQAYRDAPDRHSYELNPAIASVQRLIRSQAD